MSPATQQHSAEATRPSSKCAAVAFAGSHHLRRRAAEVCRTGRWARWSRRRRWTTPEEDVIAGDLSRFFPKQVPGYEASEDGTNPAYEAVTTRGLIEMRDAFEAAQAEAEQINARQ